MKVVPVGLRIFAKAAASSSESASALPMVVLLALALAAICASMPSNSPPLRFAAVVAAVFVLSASASRLAMVFAALLLPSV